jgi:hypothetical protein
MGDGSVTITYNFASEEAKARDPTGNWRDISIREWTAAHPELKAGYEFSLQEIAQVTAGSDTARIYNGADGKPVAIFKRGGTLLYVTQTLTADNDTLASRVAALTGCRNEIAWARGADHHACSSSAPAEGT